jgi:hypothetical protein
LQFFKARLFLRRFPYLIGKTFYSDCCILHVNDQCRGKITLPLISYHEKWCLAETPLHPTTWSSNYLYQLDQLHSWHIFVIILERSKRNNNRVWFFE